LNDYAPWVVINFSAKWCGPCQKLNTRALVESTPDIKWYSVDVDINDILCNSIDKKFDFLNIIVEQCVSNESGDVVTFNHSNIDMLHLIREVFFSIGYKATISSDKSSISLHEEQIERFITSIEYSHEEEAQRIMVDNNEHLYVTDDYIVTHNTTMFTKLANSAFNRGYKVLQIFFEDTPKVIQRKHLSCWTGINLSELSQNKEEIQEFIENLGDDSNLRLKKMDSTTTTMTTIKTYVRKLISSGFKPDIILIDYIDCIKPSQKVDDVNVGEGMVMRELESMLSELDIAGWTAIQGGRCVSLDTNINIENKGVIKIGDVKLGDKILTHKGYKEVTHIFPIEKQQVYKIKTKSGKEIKVSAKHDFPISSGVLKSIRTGLSVGDKFFLKKD
jgi:thiol-disulfide isomerase/thioredoxin